MKTPSHVLLLTAAVFFTPLFALSEPPSGQGDSVPPPTSEEISAAVTKALPRLARKQNDDGTFGISMYSGHPGCVSLVGLAFLDGGHVPGQGPYGDVLNRSIEYVLSCFGSDGFMVPTVAGRLSSGSLMYGQALSLLFLSRCYLTADRKDLKAVLERGVAAIVAAQNDAGAWRYTAQKLDGDVSVTSCVLVALAAVRDAGIAVPDATLRRGTEYLKRMQNADGGFAYKDPGAVSNFPRTAAAVTVLLRCEPSPSDAMKRGLAYVERHRRTIPSAFNNDGHFLYGEYYAALALSIAKSDNWPAWHAEISRILLARQQPDGRWFASAGPEYATATACIILQMHPARPRGVP